MTEEPPLTFDALQRSFRVRRAVLPKKLVEVGDFISSFPDQVAFQSIATVAHHAGTSPSGVVRFAHAFHLDGYVALQLLCRERLINLSKHPSPGVLAEPAVELVRHSAGFIGQLESLVQSIEFENLVSELALSRRVCLDAEGSAVTLLELFQDLLVRNGIAVSIVPRDIRRERFLLAALPDRCLLLSSIERPSLSNLELRLHGSSDNGSEGCSVIFQSAASTSSALASWVVLLVALSEAVGRRRLDSSSILN